MKHQIGFVGEAERQLTKTLGEGCMIRSQVAPITTTYKIYREQGLDKSDWASFHEGLHRE